MVLPKVRPSLCFFLPSLSLQLLSDNLTYDAKDPDGKSEATIHRQTSLALIHSLAPAQEGHSKATLCSQAAFSFHSVSTLSLLPYCLMLTQSDIGERPCYI